MRREKATAFGDRVQEHCMWHVRSNSLARDTERKEKNKKKHIGPGATATCVMRGVECTGDNFSCIDPVED